MTRRGPTLAIAVRLLCAIGLLMLGLAHHAALAPAAAAYNSAEFALPDGTYASLCITSDDDRGKQPLPANCEVCRLAASVILPMPDQDGWLRSDMASVFNPPMPPAETLSKSPTEGPKSRGPPALA